MVIALIGVAGSGKTSVGRALAAHTDAVFVDADDLHTQANVSKMRSGVPLTDDDRREWLERVRAEIERLVATGRAGVVACSALKRRYRDVLRQAGAGLVFVHLRAERDVIRRRIEERAGSHFMPVSLVESQFETLEEPQPDEDALTVEIDARPPEEIVAEIVERLGLGRSA